MNTWDQIKIGLKGYSIAGQLIFKKEFFFFMLFPVVLNIILFYIGYEYIGELTVKAQDLFRGYVNIEGADFWGAEYLQKALSGFIWIVVKVLFFVIFAYTGGYIIIILLSPVFSVISNKTEKYLTGGSEDSPFNFKLFIRDIIRGLVLTIRNITIENFLMILMFLIGFIPVIGIIGPVFMFFAASYFFGFSYMDYTNERRGRDVRKSISYIWRYKWVAIANGAMFSLTLFIPLCGAGLSAFVAIISSIAGTASMLEIQRFENFNKQNIINSPNKL